MATATETDTPSISVAANIGEAIADGLTSHGFDVRNPASEQSCYLQLTNVQTTLVNLEISPNGLDWECRCFENSPHDPDRATAIVLAILNADNTATCPESPDRISHATLKEQIGQAAASHGMYASLIVIDPQKQYAEVAITNPAKPGRGTVSVTDDGAIRWHCNVNYRSDSLRHLAVKGALAGHRVVHDQSHRAVGLHASEIADTIARALEMVPKTN